MRLAVAALCHSLHYLASADPLHAIFFFFFNDTATTEIYTLSLHDALPISATRRTSCTRRLSRSSAGSSTRRTAPSWSSAPRSEEHTSELQSPCNLVCRLLLEKKKMHAGWDSDGTPVMSGTAAGMLHTVSTS